MELVISANQMRAARALVDMSQSELARLTGISLPTLRNMENDKIGPQRSLAGNVEKVIAALRAAGVEFIERNGGGPGVRMRE